MHKRVIYSDITSLVIGNILVKNNSNKHKNYTSYKYNKHYL